MNCRALTLTVSLLLLCLLTDGVHAVHVAPGGMGQVLLYPYYTVRQDGINPYDTYITVSNNTVAAKLVRLRLREALAGVPVFSAEILLSPHDTWAAAVVRTQEGADLVTADGSCIVGRPLQPGVTHFPLSNTGYSDFDDGAGTSLDRTREGFIEVIELGSYSSPTVVDAARPDAQGRRNCAQVDAIRASLLATNPLLPSGGLYGTLQLINVAAGVAFSANAVALDNFTTRSLTDPSSASEPNLASGNVTFADLMTSEGSVRVQFDRAIDAVSAAITATTMTNDFNVLTETDSGTDWVVTFPTKHHYVQRVPAAPLLSNAPAPARPFQSNFYGASCDATNPPALASREGGILADIELCAIICPRRIFTLCYAASVSSIDKSGILGSSRGAGGEASGGTLVVTSSLQTRNNTRTGRFSLAFDQPHQRLSGRILTASGQRTAHVIGLPLIGFSAYDYANRNALPGVLATYGVAFKHNITTRIEMD